jgi:hypothetical protein
MRTTLFFPTLLAVTLAGGAALAEKSAAPINHLRAHGDAVDKSYRATEHHASSLQGGPQRVEAPSHPTFDGGASRVSCSENGVDCPHRGGRASMPEAGGGQAGRAARAPAFLDKVLGSDRTTFNEAGEAQAMSARAASRAWSHAGASGGATMILSGQQQHARAGEQASSNRMSCNDADECMMSSKGVKKEWAYRSVRAGTWKGPEAAQPAATGPAPTALAAPTAQPVLSGHPMSHAAKVEATKHDP